MTQVDVTVIIPSYNRLWSLPRAIDSCRNTKCTTEIIVVDDCSTDGTWDWLQQQTDIISLRQDMNRGQTYAINKGAAIARGKYIRSLDSDDFLATGIIDRQFEAAEQDQADIVVSGCDLYWEKDGSITQNPEVEPWDDFMEVQLGTAYGSHMNAMLFRAEFFKNLPRSPDFSMRDDRLILLEAGLENPKISYVSGCGVYWVQHNTQMQNNYDGMRSIVANWQHLNIYKKIIPELERRNALSPARIQSACNGLWNLSHWIAKTHIREAQRVVDWIFQLKPDYEIPESGALAFLYKTLGYSWTQRILRVRRFLMGRN